MNRFKRRASLLLLMAIAVMGTAHGQLIQSEDTACVGNPFHFSTPVSGANSYYWSFCAANLNSTPTGSSIVAGTGLGNPAAICMAKAGDSFFVFVVNDAEPQELLCYQFGTSLAGSPAVKNLGSFGDIISDYPKGMWAVQDGNNWHIFLTAGSAGASQLIRYDFGTSLNNAPSAVDMGSLSGLLLNPHDIYVFKEGNNWYAYTTSFSNLIRLDFGASITNTPTFNIVLTTGDPFSLPTGFWPQMENGNWHLFMIDNNLNSLFRLDFGPSLLNIPNALDMGTFNNIFQIPRDIVLIKDCGNWYGYVTNSASSEIVKLDFGGLLTNVPAESNLGNFAGLSGPRYLTHMLRDKQNVYCFTANFTDNSISRLEYVGCNVPDIPSSILQNPPPVTFNQPGLYNVYLGIDEGLPTMQTDCKIVRVLPVPRISLHNDTTICFGDTIQMTANGRFLYNIQWDPTYNMIPSSGDTETVDVYPREKIKYDIHMDFYSSTVSCSYDTAITVDVHQVTADAGPDRFVADGAYTELGGTQNLYGKEYTYLWTPKTFLDNNKILHPRCNPTQSQFYILTVTDIESGCLATDSVYVFTECTDVNLPNAFNPVSNIQYNHTFGLLNRNIVKLEYFRIYNRWGNKVFETTDPTVEWDGTQNNIPAPSDNYVWIVDGYCNNGTRIKKQGTVLLIR